MATTSHLEITLLEQSQAQKEITINEAFARLDAVLNSGAIDRDLATPPVSPSAGDVYIVAASPTGAWSGKADQVAYFDQIWRFITPREGFMLWVNDEDVRVVYAGSAWQVVDGSGGSTGFATVAEGRLTLTSGIAVTTSNVTAATTLYFTPYGGNRLALYNGSAWELISFSEVSLAVPATTSTMYDVWVYNSGGSAALEATAWTNDTTRATALALQNGVYVKSGAPTRRYVGSFRTTSVSGRTEDSTSNRFVWNYYNRIQRLMNVQDATASWGYSTNAWRQANGNTANQVNFVIGVAEDAVNANLQVTLNNNTTTIRSVYIGIGLDSVAANSAFGLPTAQTPASTARFTMYSQFSNVVGVGCHYLAWLERGAGADTQTWQGGPYGGISAMMWG